MRKYIAVALALCLLTTLAQAQDHLVESLTVSTPSEVSIKGDMEFDYHPRAAVLGDLLCLVWQTWDPGTSTGPDADIVLRTFDGNEWSDVIEVSSPQDSGDDTNPAICVHDGVLYIAWESVDGWYTDGPDWDILVAAFDGTNVTDPVEITPAGDKGNDYYPCMASLDGKLYLAWESQDTQTVPGADSDIALSVLDSQGWSAALGPTENSLAEDHEPSLAVLDGKLWTIWRTKGFDNYTHGDDWDIIARSFDPVGQQWNPFAELSPVNDTGDDFHPYALAHDDSLYVAWHTGDPATSSGTDEDVVFITFDGAWGNVTDLSWSHDTGGDQYPMLFAFKGETFALWQTMDPSISSGGDWDIVVGPLGSQSTIEITPGKDTGLDGGITRRGADVAVYNGEAHVFWQSADPSTTNGTDWDIVHAVVSVPENKTGSSPGDAANPREEEKTRAVTLIVVGVAGACVVAAGAGIYMNHSRKAGGKDMRRKKGK